MTFQTNRLFLRPWCDSDAAILYSLAKNPDIGPAAGWPIHTSVENSLQIIQSVLSAPETYAVCLKDTNTPIGSIGLKFGDNTDMTDRDDACELGYWIGKAYWGHGYIPEAAFALLHYAFMDLKVQTVWCGYYDGNYKSKRVQEKCGFLYHHTSENVDVPLLGEQRTGHVSCLTIQHYLDLLRNMYI